MKSSIKDFFRKCDQTHKKLWIGHIYEEILSGKFRFLCGVKKNTAKNTASN